MAYPIDLKAKAVAALAANEGNVYRTAKQLGVSRATINKWAAKAEAEPEFAAEVTEKKADLADMCEQLARKLCKVMLDDDRIEAARYGELNSGYGTSIDKMRLLREQPTSIVGDSARVEASIRSWLKEFPGGTREEAVRYLGEFLPEVRDLGKVG